MRWFALVLLVALPLAGCIGTQGDAANESPATDGENETKVAFDSDAPESAKTSGEHRHPQWQGETEKTIFDGTVQAGDCYGQVFGALVFLISAAFEQRVEKGCATVSISNGTLVPQGTEKIEVQVDASDALESGGYDSHMWTGENSYDGATTTETVKTWWFEVVEEDWDGPHQSRSSYGFLFEAEAQDTGEVAQLEGPMEIEIRAHKIPGWTPPLAAAHLDHWQLGDRHDFIKDDVIETLNRTETVAHCTWQSSIQGGCDYWDQELNLSDIIPPGTRQVALVMTWDGIDDCAPAHNCSLRAYIRSGGSSYAYTDPVAQGNGHLIYVYNVPEDVPPDSTYANESESFVIPRIDHCIEDPTPVFSFTSCGLGNANWAPRADVHFAMEAWNGAVDLEDVQDRRLG